MSTLVTPSAKSHERVTGRWNQDIKAKTKQDWSSYYVKQIVGTPLPCRRPPPREHPAQRATNLDSLGRMDR